MKKLLSLLFLICAGCNGFQQSSEPSFGGSEDGNSINLDYKLVVSGGALDGRLVVDQIQNSVLTLRVPVGLVNQLPLTNSFVFSQVGLSGRVFADTAGFKTVELKLPLALISQGVNAPLVSALPNGDSLDFLGIGQVQHLSFSLDTNSNVQIHLYSSPPRLVGAFVQTPFDFGFSNLADVVPVGGMMRAGYASTHPHRAPLNGGRFVFISLPQ